MPKTVRTALGVGPGDRIRYVVVDDGVKILPLRPVARLFGAFGHDGPPASLEDMERAIAEGSSEE